MAYVARPSDFHGAQPYQAVTLPPVQLTPSRPGLWRRLLEMFLNAQQHAAQRAVEQYVARRGKLTDSMEREIADRIMNNHF